ncbi:hypothetical protein [Methanoplanus limicola]|uniref:Plasmid stabilization system n=1 Tax=Methanoplanus limicola DSM 2279 TaxID=937775 RepID=H1Z3V7_9EURY|nr:hypothetical protein [Methanoplanus limicola]EHQ36579.1 plasmid stabilization system [Methanoplanus limicola DSM 2279]
MYKVLISDDADEYFQEVSKKDKAHIRDIILLCLVEYLKRPNRRCNKKLIKGSSPKTYRLHISMTHTIFYRIEEEKKIVKVIDAMNIDQAHSRYKLF